MSTRQNTPGGPTGQSGQSGLSGVYNKPSNDDDEAQETLVPAAEREPPVRPRVYTQAPMRSHAPTARSEPYSAFVPLLLGGVALAGWLVFQAVQLNAERQTLQTAFASQQQTVDSAAKLRATLDTLAADTQRLADSGNPTARTLVDELKKRGVTISTAPANAASAPGVPATPAPAR